MTGAREARCLARWTGAALIRLWKEDLGIDVSGLLDDRQVVGLWQSDKSDLQFFHPIVTGDEDLYAQLRRRPWYLQPDKWEFREAARHLGRFEQVLDLGAGAQAFRAFVGPECYSALDPYADSATASREAYDVVCAFQVLEHVANPLAFVAEAKARLKPGGRLFLGVPRRDSYLAALRDFPLDLPPHHVTRWSSRALEVLARAAALRVEAIAASPLEPWELPLCWMARLERWLPRPAGGRSRRSRVLAYLAARGLSAVGARPPTAGGGTLLLRARS